MVMLSASVAQTGKVLFSKSLQRQISSLARLALVQPGHRSAPVLTSAAGLGEPCPDTAAAALRRQLQPGAANGFRPRRAGGPAAQALAARLPDPELAADLAAGRGWTLFSCSFEDGSEDLIALKLEGGPHDAHCSDILQAIWPVLREDSLRELAGETQAAVTSALLWTISKKTDSAVLVLDGEGTLLHCNESGRDMLDGGALLSDGSGRLSCASPGETAGFYAAVAECARSQRGGGGSSGQHPRELILFLEERDSGMRLPVSLTRYRCAGADMPLVVAILPRQPDRTRIEMLAQKMGLSPSEARVAALIQLGLSNREAAHIAGLKEQTFNTYAKRVLAKLQSAGRAEMAQRLTWQASLGRAS
ncbi:helix-turn-helix transcriptional regulator [Leisingera sp. HS039]|uniref:helix-turn-helix transcriptional regulator n=1 Tax=unclassified Leisingera TaxID=2614906 RepID=UPI001B3A2311|nr:MULTISPECIES: helix-turn-helix transcriptional regulator [unclassified Leisingera]MBQ4824424.1 helix-turn-helix transcriptional regulator [Leisingera sp. HS039]MCF6430554.1 helix-turn-helix transcriptional regulator [Leisingera sp. MMG026]